ncbi:MAG: hypothetical protein K6C41_08205 [Lachnospiraceae bacterium]|nr:hypothetical protein [Lachnospiraceae bacterium]
MEIKKLLCIEDTYSKYMDIFNYLKPQKISTIDRAADAKDAVKYVETAANENDQYDLIISDMNFDYFGQDDPEAGEKTMALLREKGYNIPTIICSADKLVIPGTIGSIFYNPDRNWEAEADALFKKIREL